MLTINKVIKFSNFTKAMAKTYQKQKTYKIEIQCLNIARKTKSSHLH